MNATMELVLTAFLGQYDIFNKNTLLGNFAGRNLYFVIFNFWTDLGSYCCSGWTCLRIFFSFLVYFGAWVWRFLLFLAEAVLFYAFCNIAQ